MLKKVISNGDTKSITLLPEVQKCEDVLFAKHKAEIKIYRAKI